MYLKSPSPIPKRGRKYKTLLSNNARRIERFLSLLLKYILKWLQTNPLEAEMFFTYNNLLFCLNLFPLIFDIYNDSSLTLLDIKKPNKMKLYKKIFENNKAWIEKKKTVDSNYFTDLSEGQSPEILYIGCSDSRVTAEEVTGVGPGQMFVHRNVGNIIPNNDLSSATVIDYAVKHLQIKHIVICGHYFCGG